MYHRAIAPKADKLLIARSSPAGLAWWASGGDAGESLWVPARHLMLLSQRIVEVATGRCPRLIVTMPPRHGKSELISRFTPAWFLGNFPDSKVMLCSYADTFAAQWGRKARDVLEEFGPQVFGVRVSQDSASAQQWELAGREGVMVTAGVGGGITGKGAHLLIVDDPVKNAEDAASAVIQEKHIEWWRSTARTRLQKGAGVILVMTRWNENDLAGQLLADAVEGGDQWEVLNLPAYAEDDDALGRSPGEVLWPEMFDDEWMQQTRRALGSYWFTALYQQRPAPAEGMLFKRSNFRYFVKSDATNDRGEQICRVFRDDGEFVFDPGYGMKFCTVDVAASEKTSADFTVVATWLVTPHRDLLLWDVERVQFEGPDIAPLLRRVFYEQRPSIIGIERLGYGLQIIQELVREGLPIVRLEPDADKISRALPAVARYEEGRVYHPRGASWLDEFEAELLTFPNAAHDDQVDVVAYAAMQLPLLGGGPSSRGVERAARARGRGRTITGGLLAEQL